MQGRSAAGCLHRPVLRTLSGDFQLLVGEFLARRYRERAGTTRPGSAACCKSIRACRARAFREGAPGRGAVCRAPAAGLLDTCKSWIAARSASRGDLTQHRLVQLASASKRFSRAFSFSSALSFFAWSVFRPPYALRQRSYVCSGTSSSLQTAATELPFTARPQPDAAC